MVAYNLALGRKDRGWDQATFCKHLQSTAGLKWSVATLSAAESGWYGTTGRLRHFDVTEIVAFALTLKLPLAWFLLPPEVTPQGVPAAQGAWVGLDSSRRTNSRLLGSDQLRFLVLTQHDPDDADDLMGARLRRDGVVRDSIDPSEIKRVWELLSQVVDRHTP